MLIQTDLTLSFKKTSYGLFRVTDFYSNAKLDKSIDIGLAIEEAKGNLDRSRSIKEVSR